MHSAHEGQAGYRDPGAELEVQCCPGKRIEQRGIADKEFASESHGESQCSSTLVPYRVVQVSCAALAECIHTRKLPCGSSCVERQEGTAVADLLQHAASTQETGWHSCSRV